jgi:hypothetical protein
MPDKLIPVFIPSLGALLLAAENKKGSPLTEQEVLRVRDQASSIMMERKDAVLMTKTRGRVPPAHGKALSTLDSGLSTARLNGAARAVHAPPA